MSSQRVCHIFRSFWSSRAFDKSYALKITLPALCRVPGGERKIELRKGAVKVLVTQSCPTLSDPMDCSLPGSSTHGILQARILQWIAIPFFRGSFQPRGQTWISCIPDKFFTTEPPGKSCEHRKSDSKSQL